MIIEEKDIIDQNDEPLIYTVADLADAVAEAIAKEREACAEICACEALRWGESPKLTLSVAEHWMKGYEEGANSSAEKIRARGEK
jgi:hypothetical protein